MFKSDRLLVNRISSTLKTSGQSAAIRIRSGATRVGRLIELRLRLMGLLLDCRIRRRPHNGAGGASENQTRSRIARPCE
jgi:hypothetical protein